MALRATGITVKYGSLEAVSGVDIEVDPGILHGVIGPNGAGKSTLIDALSGRRRPTAGHVFLDGEDITDRSVQWRRQAGIARSFQKTSVFPAMLVRDQLEMVADRTGEKDLEGIAGTLGLTDSLDRVCSEISYGQQRSVDIALALMGDPRVVLLDEPAAGLAPDEAVRMLDHLRELCQAKQVAAVLVEHDVEGVFRVCDYVTVLALGKVLSTGLPAEVRKDEGVIAAYLGRTG